MTSFYRAAIHLRRLVSPRFPSQGGTTLIEAGVPLQGYQASSLNFTPAYLQLNELGRPQGFPDRTPQYYRRCASFDSCVALREAVAKTPSIFENSIMIPPTILQ